ncbi:MULTISPECIES: ribonuclease P protein component [Subtercola]|uniref:Ribonuclease P protein component n=1 Tax=Subtercola vilae TaxID=2056433 RepID=A0A4T2CAG4_9MICO|nr:MULTISPECIES: ribonuclease P protein component [Subtercola]MEA9985387.1 ribonuclease P protein component [Subtercola sp. RTI3]TIH40869.1 ribonuclease P protein component [Subtercola vilae]
MLAKTSRITTADEYRSAVRRGARFVAPNSVTYVRRDSGSPTRFGFIVAKSVGVAVVRNRVRRRLKAACYSLLPTVIPGSDVVIRALPGAATRSFAQLRAELIKSLGKASVLSTASLSAASDSPAQFAAADSVPTDSANGSAA